MYLRSSLFALSVATWLTPPALAAVVSITATSNHGYFKTTDGGFNKVDEVFGLLSYTVEFQRQNPVINYSSSGQIAEYMQSMGLSHAFLTVDGKSRFDYYGHSSKIGNTISPPLSVRYIPDFALYASVSSGGDYEFSSVNLDSVFATGGGPKFPNIFYADVGYSSSWSLGNGGISGSFGGFSGAQNSFNAVSNNIMISVRDGDLVPFSPLTSSAMRIKAAAAAEKQEAESKLLSLSALLNSARADGPLKAGNDFAVESSIDNVPASEDVKSNIHAGLNIISLSTAVFGSVAGYLSSVLNAISFAKAELAKIERLIADDPPDNNYKEIYVPSNSHYNIPITSNQFQDISKYQSILNNTEDYAALLQGALHSVERYEGAIIAGDYESAALQKGAYFHYLDQSALLVDELNSGNMFLGNILAETYGFRPDLAQDLVNLSLQTICSQGFSNPVRSGLLSIGAEADAANTSACQGPIPIVPQYDAAIFANSFSDLNAPSAIPESSTWVQMIVGMILIGLILRKGRLQELNKPIYCVNELTGPLI